MDALSSDQNEKLLEAFRTGNTPSAESFKSLVQRLDNHQLLAKVFLLEGTPFVFQDSPMKYTVFKEQVGDQFGIGSQDVCIVGSARLGFSPSPARPEGKPKFGTPFKETSDVDVVVVSFDLFDQGQRQLFTYLNRLGPGTYQDPKKALDEVKVQPEHWRTIKEAYRNLTYQNFNPGPLPAEDPLRIEVFEKISSTSGLFLALEPQVFVSKIRARVFRDWRATESYYANSLRLLKRSLDGEVVEEADDIGDEPEPEIKAEFRPKAR